MPSKEVKLTFRGDPVIPDQGIEAFFFSKAIPAFTKLIRTIALDPEDQEKAEAANPEKTPLLITRLTGNTCWLTVPESDQEADAGILELADVIQGLYEDDQETTVRNMSALTSQALDDLKKFLAVIAATSAQVSMNYGTTEATIDDLPETKKILKLLNQLNKSENLENEVKVTFLGYLPKQKKAEFVRVGNQSTISANVNGKAQGADTIIDRINEERSITLHTKQSAGKKPTHTIITIRTG